MMMELAASGSETLEKPLALPGMMTTRPLLPL